MREILEIMKRESIETAFCRCSSKYVFSKISQNSQENICAAAPVFLPKLIFNCSLFFISNAFFQQPLFCLTFSWIELQMLLRCSLIHKSFMILRPLHLQYLCSCHDVGLLMSRLCGLFFIFIFIFIMINRTILWIQAHLFFCLYFRTYTIFLDDNVDEDFE